MKAIRFGLLPRILVAIALGIGLGIVSPDFPVRLFVTFNGIFSQFLGFLVPLIIVGLVTPAIADVDKGEGGSAPRMLLLTVILAYGATLLSGFFSFGICSWLFPHMITPGIALDQISQNATSEPFFSIAIPEPLNIMTALVLSFTVGLGLTRLQDDTLRRAVGGFKEIVVMAIQRVILPLLPIYIFGIFFNMAHSGQVFQVLLVFAKIIGVIFAMHVVLLLAQYAVAGAVSGKNPLRLLSNMLPAYFTALGTQSSAATIPVTLRQTVQNGVQPEVAGFVVPLCATIHLSGSTLKIVACALALMTMQGMDYSFGQVAGFICMLGVTMVAAPGVPGGAIMAALGVLASMLGFSETDQALMIALYIAMDSFGTACNVTGDGALALIVDRVKRIGLSRHP